jgi:predicted Zn-dependent protease with MMP-like domain
VHLCTGRSRRICSLPEEFRIRLQNVAILVEDFPANQRPPKLGQRERLLLAIFHGVPATKRSVFNLPTTGSHRALPEEY